MVVMHAYCSDNMTHLAITDPFVGHGSAWAAEKLPLCVRRRNQAALLRAIIDDRCTRAPTTGERG
jgi:hypothetical protein